MTHRLFLLVALIVWGLAACSPTAEPAAAPLNTPITKPTESTVVEEPTANSETPTEVPVADEPAADEAPTDEPKADSNNNIVELDQSFTLQNGQTVEIAATAETVTFKTIEDSRCPAGMACVWAGSLIVGLDVVDANGRTVAVDLSLDDPTVTDQGQLPSGLKITLVDDGTEKDTSLEAWQITLIVQS